MRIDVFMALLPGVAILVSGCEQRQASAPAVPAAAAVTRVSDLAVLARGRELFQAHCATCHGARAEGALQWQRADAQGKYPPPPLDGTGHAWHHPSAGLKQVINQGTQKIGSNMPAWGNRLSDQDIEAIIAWFQSLWPPEIHQAWAELEARSRAESAR